MIRFMSSVLFFLAMTGAMPRAEAADFFKDNMVIYLVVLLTIYFMFLIPSRLLARYNGNGRDGGPAAVGRAMALTLSCSCGANFEVEDTFAGQTVSCPECQASLKAPAVVRGPLRTSGLAVASMVLALVGAFTFVGTLAAVLCGLAALVSIGRSGGRRAGVGFALFGVVAGVLFTGLTLFAYSTGELFGVGDQVR